MAIGARILSDNLSGKTTTVTFLPTTGGTIDLGTQVIPFNNITSFPYGTYEIYVPEYDYTYTLIIEEPVDNGQSFILLSTNVGGSTYAAATLNFNDFTAEIIDFGLDVSIWESWDIYPLTNKGYFYVYKSTDNTSWLSIFTDSYNNIIGQYSAVTSNIDYDFLDGKSAYFNDRENGVFKYFDTVDVYTYVYDQYIETLNVQWDWDGVSSNNSIIFTIDNSDTLTSTSFLYTSGTSQTISTWVTADENRYYGLYVTGNFFYELVQSGGFFQNMKLYSQDGTLLQTLSISGDTYIDIRLNYFGDNKLMVVFYNYPDTIIDYNVFYYNGNTNVLDNLQHNRSNYTEIVTVSDTNFWPNDYSVDNAFINLFTTNSTYVESIGYEVSYFDTLCLFGDTNDIQIVTYQDSGLFDKSINYWGYPNNSLITFGGVSTGDTNTIFVTSGGTISLSEGLTTDTVSRSYWSFGNKYASFNFSDGNYTGGTMYLYSNDGTFLDSVFVTLSSAYNYNSRSEYNTFYFKTTTQAWYVNTSVSAFTATDIYDYTRSNNYRYSPTYHTPSSFLLYNPDGTARVINESTISDEFTLPNFATSDNWDIEMGENYFMYVYHETSSPTTNIVLFDYDGNIVNSETISYDNSNGWSADSSNDRYIFRYYDGTNNNIYLVSESTITYVTVSDYSTNDIINDIVWWD